MWIVEVLEFASSDGKGAGQYQLTARSDEMPVLKGKPIGLSRQGHRHASRAEAQDCLECRDFMRAVTGIPMDAPQARAAASDAFGYDFGEAIRLLKAGKRVARAGWDGKSMWIALSGPLEGRSIQAESFWSEHGKAHALANGGYAKVLPSVIMKTATGEILMGWLASQTDMLAEDWMEV